MQGSPLPPSQGLVLRKPYSSQAVCSIYTTKTPSSSLATELFFPPLSADLEQQDGNIAVMRLFNTKRKTRKLHRHLLASCMNSSRITSVGKRVFSSFSSLTSRFGGNQTLILFSGPTATHQLKQAVPLGNRKVGLLSRSYGDDGSKSTCCQRPVLLRGRSAGLRKEILLQGGAAWPDLPACCTHESPPHKNPCHCKLGHLGPSGTNFHLGVRWSRPSSGSVVRNKARSTRIGHRPESRGRCSRGCFPHGFLCSYTHLWETR
ncbi:hypothetical protein GOODEAATRI_003081 [Goodea atripinnis]|uniref:Uncharacterized protein n=1 Tax=Goodea atripinnis TaxID=208336 RepID=A0ABV0PAY9_9TELE